MQVKFTSQETDTQSKLLTWGISGQIRTVADIIPFGGKHEISGFLENLKKTY
jgi:hypothetical protein